MIAKVFRSQDLSHLLDYVYREDKRPEVLDSTCVGVSRQDAYDSIQRQLRMSETTSTDTIVHATVSIEKQRELEWSRWKSIASEVTRELGLEQHAYVAVRHRDTDHDHIHIVASRVSEKGKVAAMDFDYYRVQEVMRRMEREHGLQQLPSREERMQAPEVQLSREVINYERRTGQVSQKRLIQQALFEARKERDATSWRAKLKQHDVTIRCRKHPESGKIEGISYHRQGVSVPGYRLGRSASWTGLVEEKGFHARRDHDALTRPEPLKRDPREEKRHAVLEHADRVLQESRALRMHTASRRQKDDALLNAHRTRQLPQVLPLPDRIQALIHPTTHQELATEPVKPSPPQPERHREEDFITKPVKLPSLEQAVRWRTPPPVEEVPAVKTSPGEPPQTSPAPQFGLLHLDRAFASLQASEASSPITAPAQKHEVTTRKELLPPTRPVPTQDVTTRPTDLSLLPTRKVHLDVATQPVPVQDTPGHDDCLSDSVQAPSSSVAKTVHEQRPVVQAQAMSRDPEQGVHQTTMIGEEPATFARKTVLEPVVLNRAPAQEFTPFVKETVHSREELDGESMTRLQAPAPGQPGAEPVRRAQPMPVRSGVTEAGKAMLTTLDTPPAPGKSPVKTFKDPVTKKHLTREEYSGYMREQGVKMSSQAPDRKLNVTILERDIRLKEGRFTVARDDKNVLHMVPHRHEYNQMRGHSTTLEQDKNGVSKLNPSPQLEQQRTQSQQVKMLSNRVVSGVKQKKGSTLSRLNTPPDPGRAPVLKIKNPERTKILTREEFSGYMRSQGVEISSKAPDRKLNVTILERDVFVKEGRFTMARDDKNVLHMVPHQSAYNQMRRHSTTLEKGKDGVSKLNLSPQLEQQRASQPSKEKVSHVQSKKQESKLLTLEEYCKRYKEVSHGAKIEPVQPREVVKGNLFDKSSDIYVQEGRFAVIYDEGKYATGLKLVKYSRELEAWRDKDVEIRYRDNKQLEIKAMEKSKNRGMER